MEINQKFDGGLLQALSLDRSHEGLTERHSVLASFKHEDTAAQNLAVAYALRSVGPRLLSGMLTQLELKLLAAHEEVLYIKLVETLSPA